MMTNMDTDKVNNTKNVSNTKKANKIKKVILAAALAGAFCVGGTAAYLTDSGSAVNAFTVGKVTIDLKEPSWNADNAKLMVPSQVIDKDPQITNTGKNDAYVYLEIDVPISKVATADTSGNRIAAADTELFSFTADKDWTLLTSASGKKDDKQVYVYAYSKVLKTGETTSALFKQVTFANVIEGQLEGKSLELPVYAYAIQTVNTGGNTGTVADQAAAAYEKYLNQNKNGKGAEAD
jgi:predicted ribosomally synthesized peptide with SipW-like signal peptide